MTPPVFDVVKTSPEADAEARKAVGEGNFLPAENHAHSAEIQESQPESKSLNTDQTRGAGVSHGGRGVSLGGRGASPGR